MKLVTFSAGGERILGALKSDGVIDLSAVLSRNLDMTQLISRWEELRERVTAATATGTPIPIDQVVLQAPIARPGKIMAIGLNYGDHIAESGLSAPERQLWFVKTASSVNGPFDPIELPHVSNALDYEAELVAVIGRRARHVTMEQAANVVFGYCAGNDVSVRDWQKHSTQFTMGKSFDTHTPYGPWITTSDEIKDPHNLEVRCLVNGEVRQHSNTRHMVFNLYQQIAYLSQAMTLEPGDLIFTGTPGGVGAARRPQVFLKAGDHVRVEVEHVGAIEAIVVKEKEVAKVCGHADA